jgi:hypothetical protein
MIAQVAIVNFWNALFVATAPFHILGVVLCIGVLYFTH